jgi:hypothetical protein
VDAAGHAENIGGGLLYDPLQSDSMSLFTLLADCIFKCSHRIKRSDDFPVQVTLYPARHIGVSNHNPSLAVKRKKYTSANDFRPKNKKNDPTERKSIPIKRPG